MLGPRDQAELFSLASKLQNDGVVVVMASVQREAQRFGKHRFPVDNKFYSIDTTRRDLGHFVNNLPNRARR